MKASSLDKVPLCLSSTFPLDISKCCELARGMKDENFQTMHFHNSKTLPLWIRLERPGMTLTHGSIRILPKLQTKENCHQSPSWEWHIWWGIHYQQSSVNIKKSVTLWRVDPLLCVGIKVIVPLSCTNFPSISGKWKYRCLMKSIVPRNENENTVKCIWDFFQKKITLCGKKSLHFNVDDFMSVLILNMTLQKKHGLKRMSKRIVFVNPSAGSYICF